MNPPADNDPASRTGAWPDPPGLGIFFCRAITLLRAFPRFISPVAFGCCVLLIGLDPRADGAVLGTNSPALPLTASRLAALPKSQRSVWEKYLERSARQMRSDHDAFAKEVRRHDVRTIQVPPTGKSLKSVMLNPPAGWYAGAEARRIADIVVSFQTPAGGWSKNLDLTTHLRAPGESYAPNNDVRHPGPSDFDLPGTNHWSYVGTFDNDATMTQLRFLARVIAAADARATAAYRRSFLRGMDYIFASQYPNGGWPQVWPLEGGYHDAITYNDNAMVNILSLLREIALGKPGFSFVPARIRSRAAARLDRGIQCILATQIWVDGRRTIWAQQHDPITLKPVSARNYEMPAAAAAESAGITLFLMQPGRGGDEQISAAIRAAAAWFAKTAIPNAVFRYVEGKGRELVPTPGGGPVWPRFSEIGTDRPIFGDRDKTIHDRLDEISPERRNGYAWYGGSGIGVLEEIGSWEREHPSSPAP